MSKQVKNSISQRIYRVIFGLVLLSCLFQASAYAQTTPALEEGPSPKWATALGILPGEFFDTPDAACRRQHQHYNPGAPYRSPSRYSYRGYACAWEMNTPTSGTIFPSVVELTCDIFPGFGLSLDGRCVRARARDGDCGCPDDGSRGPSQPPQPMIGNPVSLNYGAKVDRVDDYMTADGLFGVTRQYRSRPRNSVTLLTPREIPGFGKHWHGLIPGRIAVWGSYSRIVQYLSPSGNLSDSYSDNPDNPLVWTFSSSPNNRRRISMVSIPSSNRFVYFQSDPSILNGPPEMRMDMANGEYILFRRSGVYEANDGLRYLVPIEHGLANGYKRYFDYPDTGEYPNKIRDSVGREMILTWVDAPVLAYNPTMADPNPPVLDGPVIKVLSEILLPDQTRLQYTYGNGGSGNIPARKDRLESVRRVNAAAVLLWGRSYLYEDTRFPHSLTGTLDQTGARLSTYSYDAANLATSTEQAGGVNRYTIENYIGFPRGVAYAYRYVTNPLGRREDYTFYDEGGSFETSPQLLESVVGHATANVPADMTSFTYSGRIGDFVTTGVTDKLGNRVSFGNDNSLKPTLTNEASNTPLARSTNLTWHPVFDLVTREERPGRQIDYVYSATAQIQSRTETDTTTHTVPYATGGQSRTWVYNWAPNGRLLSLNGPRPVNAQGKDDITSFTYDALGNMLTMTNPLGHVTSFSGYDANGRPTLMTDPNGIKTAMTYDELGRVKTATRKHPTTVANDAVTAFDYDVEGRVIGITAPATEKLIMDYDLAGRLKSVRAANGERIDYSHNAMSNVTAETVKRTNASVARSITRTFDELGRMLTETLGPGRTTTYAYDKLGQIVSITSARGNATQLAYDALNRLVTTVAPDTGTTANTYDRFDDVVAYSDAAAVQTGMIRNGFGEVIQEVSPDRGTSIYYYDTAGDMSASIDGRGQRVDYARDIAGRVLTKTPVGRPVSDVITYTYDTAAISGSFGVGRLATMVDGSGTTRFRYDHRGNMLTKQQVIGTSATANLAYAYNLADQITQVTYPSGRQVLYTRDTKQRVTQVRTRATSSATLVTLMSAMVYEPFGSLKTATYGNTLKLVQDWGNDGRLAGKRVVRSNATNLSSLSYGYDNDDNMVSISDGVDGTRSTLFAFDSMNRISRIDNAGSSGPKREDQVHDKNGNRVRVERRALASDVTPVSTDTYTTTAGTNRLASISTAAGTRALAYDARGNLATDTRPGAVTATTGYDGYARLTSYARTGEASLSFTYNGMDDRVREVRGSATRRYVYDGAGRVIGEYGASATDVIAEHLWMNPDAANDNMPFGGDDGVGGYAPLAISSAPAGGTAQVIWVHGSHMGVPLAYTSTTGAEITPPVFTQNAFPGQMRTLSDLYYNRYRDYDPTTGRYIQADPIGLNGDPNPYAYAMNNPLRYSDPEGLFSDIIIRMIGDPTNRKMAERMLDKVFPPKNQCPVPSGDDDDDPCEKQYETDIGRCTLPRIKYGRKGFSLCASSALRRKNQCKRGFRLEPLAGVDTPLYRD
jgi:RHS repeat-associated protein